MYSARQTVVIHRANMADKNLKQKIIEKAVQSLLDESKVPYLVHMEVVKQLQTALADNKALISAWNKVIESHEIAKGDKGETPSDEHLLELIIPNIPPVKNGDDYVLTEQDKKDIGRSIKVPVVKQVVERIEVIHEKPVITEKLIEKKVDEDKLFDNFLKILKKKRLLDVSYIKGLEGFSKDGINYRFEELMHGGGGTSAGSITYSIDLSAQCNGVNKVFTVPANTNFVQLSGTDAPQIYRPTIDYTGTGTTTLTLTGQVNAPSNGATLILLYVV